MSALRGRIAGLDRTRVDVVFAIAVLIELQFEYTFSSWIPRGDRLVTAIASIFFAGPIAVRRVRPDLALVCSTAAAAIEQLFAGQLLSGPLNSPDGGIGPVLVLLPLSYAAGAWLEDRRSYVTVVCAVALLISAQLLPGNGPLLTGVGNVASTSFYQALLIVPWWFAGRMTRERSRRASAFRRLAAQAAAERDARNAAAIAHERARIGGELQDIIAHSVSAMVIQAGGARLALRSDPDRARDSILRVEQTGREALADLRRLLGMLRKDDDPHALAPQPGLGQLSALLHSIRETGVEFELQTVSAPIDLTPGVDLVAYRVVEAALLAAGDCQVSSGLVTIRYETRQLGLEIEGDRAIPDLEERLHAIAQRVSLYDGSLRALPAEGGGFALHASLPLQAAVPA